MKLWMNVTHDTLDGTGFNSIVDCCSPQAVTLAQMNVHGQPSTSDDRLSSALITSAELGDLANELHVRLSPSKLCCSYVMECLPDYTRMTLTAILRLSCDEVHVDMRVDVNCCDVVTLCSSARR
jgi:hypothetical protein